MKLTNLDNLNYLELTSEKVEFPESEYPTNPTEFYPCRNDYSCFGNPFGDELMLNLGGQIK